MTRAEHLAWCKERAHQAYAHSHSTADAVASMISDLGKHPETANLQETAGMLMLTVRDERGLRQFIDGFN